MSRDLNAFKSPAELAAEAALADDRDGSASKALKTSQEEAAIIAQNEADDTDTPDGEVLDAGTNTGNDDDTEIAAVAPFISPRQKALDAIAGQVQEERDETRKEFVANNPAKTDEPAAAAPIVDTAAAIIEQDTGSLRRNEQGVLCAVLKVNGEESLRPLTDVIAIAQKDTSADLKLEKASVTLRHIQRLDENLTAREQRLNSELARLQTLPQNSATLPSEKDVGKLKEAAKSFVDALADDDTDAAIDNLETLLAGRGDPIQTQEEMRTTVTTLIQEQRDIDNQRGEQQRIQTQIHEQLMTDWKSAKESFMTEFPEIKEGSESWKMASEISEKLGSDPAFQNASYAAIFREAGKRVRAVVAESTPSTRDRTQRKLDSQTHVASRSTATQTRKGNDAPAAPTQADLVTQMRRQRFPNAAY